MTVFLSKLVTSITFKKVLIWTIALVLFVVGTISYEHRTELFDIAAGTNGPAVNRVNTTFTISDRTKKDIASFVSDDRSVMGFTVYSVDIRLNAQNSLYFFTDPSAVDPPTLSPLTAITRLPLFTKNDDNNRQMVKLINGEFTCAPYGTTILATVAPTVNRSVITICRASLPPYYGHFSGYVSVFLNSDPDIDKQVRLKQMIEILATEIYFRDVIPTTRKAKI